ncbi:dual specificity protein phosphatase family protein [Vibrio neptunius]|nr:dual specificity protein phosphatase family protein [Vibrio neptunius]QXX08057.1 dual specificity protein phosphatase family protein [Vibrio neptunius]
MKELFFLDTNLAGRCGPDSSMWDIEQLKRNGVVAILSVNDGEMVHESLIKSHNIVYMKLPLSSNAPPRTGDFELCVNVLPEIVAFIKQHYLLGTVVIHCKSGKDRTGLALAAFLMSTKSITPLEAITLVKSKRNIAFTAPKWGTFALKVLKALENT